MQICDRTDILCYGYFLRFRIGWLKNIFFSNIHSIDLLKLVSKQVLEFGFFLEQKPVQTDLARFFPVWLGFFRFGFGFFSFRLIKTKPNQAVFFEILISFFGYFFSIFSVFQVFYSPLVLRDERRPLENMKIKREIHDTYFDHEKKWFQMSMDSY
jgi:hypothetical protein